MPDLNIGVQAAIQAFGTQTALAKKLGIQRAAVSQWKQVPAKWAIRIEKLTDGTVSRHVLRPDLYPHDEAA